jgi:hypothetical protein
MPSSIIRSSTAIAATAVACTTFALPALAGGPVSVTVNGAPTNLNPPPTTRAGRVFVPLRGVFESLGATVVYENGTINATGRGHSISLKIGSQAATVDGQQQTVDVAPFIIGASTYVPLRFVSQALGATVNYDGSNDVVAINTHGGGGNPPSQVITPSPNNDNNSGGAVSLQSEVPARGTTVRSRRPTVEANFGGGTVDPNTIRIYLDDLDVTQDATRSPHGFSYAPRSPLQAGNHRVRVTGTDSNGGSFNRNWGFSSGTSEATVSEITSLRPVDGTQVGNNFIVTGRTAPGAHVSVQVGVSSGGRTTIGGIIGSIVSGGQTSSASYQITADGDGAFRTPVSIDAHSGSELLLAVSATDPQSGATATPVQETLTVR